MSGMVLLEEQKKLNARIQVAGNVELVLDYGNPVAEHNHVRQNVGMIDLAFIGKIKLTGKDNSFYLHNRLSNSIETLKPGEGCYATLLDYKGRMISDLYVYRLSDFILVTTPPDTRKELATNFQKFIFGEDVQVEDITETWGIISVQGPNSKILLDQVIQPSIDKLSILQNVEREFKGLKGIIIQTVWTGEEGYHLVYPNQVIQPLWLDLLEKGKTLNVKPFGLTAFDTLRLEAGIPIFGRDMTQDNIPLEADLKHAISYTKGCYPGQEVIAKITNLSHPWRILIGLEIQSDSPIPAHSVIQVKGEHIGHVTSSAFSPTLNKIIGLGYVKWDYREPGNEVDVEWNGTKKSAIIRTLPFYIRS